MEVKQENATRRYSDVGIKRPAVEFIDLTPTKKPRIENILVTSGEQLGEFYKLKKHFVLDRALSNLPIGRYLSHITGTIKDMAWLESEMRNQTNLTGLDLRGLQLPLVLRLLGVFSTNRGIEELRLSLVTEEVAYKLSQILQVEQLTLLDLSCCSIKPSTMVPILNNPYFTGYKSLKYLDLSRNEIGSEGFNALGLVLKNNLSLQTLLISDVAQEDYSWQSFAEGLQTAQCLTRLDISYNPLSPSNAQLLVNSLATNRTLEELNMAAMSLRGIEAERVAEALKRNVSLTKLDLSRNPSLGIDGARAIAELISLGRLKTLDISFNAFTNASIAVIASTLQHNKSLTDLSLAGNRFDAAGLKSIFTALASHNLIRKLNLRDMRMPMESFTNVDLSDILKNKSLTNVETRATELKNIVNTLVTRNRKIKSLDLNSLHEHIELKDWAKVEEFFRSNPTLKLSDMVNEEIFPKQTRALLQATYEKSQSPPNTKNVTSVNPALTSPAKVTPSQPSNNNTNQITTNNNTNQTTNATEPVEEDEGDDSEEEQCDSSQAMATEFKPESILKEIAEKKIAIKLLTKEKQDVQKNINAIEGKIKEVRKDVKASEAKLAIWKKGLITPINEWTITNVILLLKELKLQHVMRNFEDKQIDGKTLTSLKSIDLRGEELGLSYKEAKIVQRAVYLIENFHSLSGGPVVFKWSSARLNEWLTENNLPHLFDNFNTSDVSSADLIFLDDCDIADWLKISSLNDKRVLEVAIEKLKSTFIKKKIPEEFLCPITHEVMKDPVVTSDGNTYDRPAIEQWLKKNNTSPLTNKQLANKRLIPNQHLKNTITKFMSDN